MEVFHFISHANFALPAAVERGTLIKRVTLCLDRHLFVFLRVHRLDVGAAFRYLTVYKIARYFGHLEFLVR